MDAPHLYKYAHLYRRVFEATGGAVGPEQVKEWTSWECASVLGLVPALEITPAERRRQRARHRRGHIWTPDTKEPEPSTTSTLPDRMAAARAGKAPEPKATPQPAGLAFAQQLAAMDHVASLPGDVPVAPNDEQHAEALKAYQAAMQDTDNAQDDA